MNLLRKSGTLVIVLSFLLACRNDDMGTVKSVASVSDVKFTAANGAVLFSWVNPVLEDMAYVEISYTDKSGELRRYLVENGLTEQWINGIGDKDYYDFRFVVYDIYGNKSDPVDISAAALEPTVNLFQGRVGITVVAKGIEITWDNDFDETFYIKVSYTDLNGGEFRYEFAAPAHTASKETVAIGAKVSGTQTLLVHVDVSDENNNISEGKTVVYHKMGAGRLKRDGWRIFASTEEVSGEGPENGHALHAIDGNGKTYWHSRWKGAGSSYPHWLLLDLGAKKRLAKVGLQHRPSTPMAREIRLYGSNNPLDGNDQKEWVIFASFDMALRDKDDKVIIAEQVFDFPAPVEYRYVKVEFVTPGEGDQRQAALAEIYLYGSDL